MNPMLITKPLNGAQAKFNELCLLGGGRKGGPAHGPTQALLAQAGKSLNKLAYHETTENLNKFAEYNPWHVCFAVAMAWGHLAQMDPDFIESSVRLLADWNDHDLKIVRKYCTERGPDTVQKSLIGGHMMFRDVVLPKALPTTINKLRDAQQRWLGRIIGKNRPPYIGGWNGTAMFMVALFADRKMADEMREPDVLLPPSGAIFNGLTLLHRAGILPSPASGSSLDDEDAEPGVLYENNATFAKILLGHSGWNMLDIHSGIYMLGTRLPESCEWFPL
jgi:hypothetical protein